MYKPLIWAWVLLLVQRAKREASKMMWRKIVGEIIDKGIYIQRT
jgi:hypothetical protein